MRNSLMTAVAAATLLLAASPVLAKGGTWVPVSLLQNSTAMTLFGIDDSNNITGQYTDSSGAVHGFLSDFAGDKYSSFDDVDGDTQPRAMNDKDAITGFDAGAFAPWERAKKKLVAITKSGTDLDQVAQGINSAGNFVGDYTDPTTSLLVGYVGKNAKWTSDIKLSTKNGGYAGRGIDTAGDMAGWYYDPTTNLQRGWLIVSGSKKPTLLDFPNAQYTVVEGMNDNGYVVGQYEDASSIIHGWIYTVKTKKFTQLDAPGAVSLTQVWNINNNNVVTASSDAGNFVYCVASKGCPGTPTNVNNRPAKYIPARP